MLTIFGAAAELEREYIRQRQSEGIAIAQAEGRFNGRPKKAEVAFESVYINWKAGRISAAAASRQCEIARSTFYRKVKDYERERGDFW